MLGVRDAVEAGAPISLTLVEEINHRVVNEYAEAISTLSIAASGLMDSTAKTILGEVAARLHDHAQSHRALLPPGTSESIDLAGYLAGICHAFTKSTLAERGIGLALSADESALPADHCWRIGLIIVELIRNAARHGLRGTGGHIRVSITERSGWLSCEVRDDGRPAVRVVPGRGQGLIRSLVADLSGEVAWTFTSRGTAAVVQLPIGKIAMPPVLSAC